MPHSKSPQKVIGLSEYLAANTSGSLDAKNNDNEYSENANPDIQFENDLDYLLNEDNCKIEANYESNEVVIETQDIINENKWQSKTRMKKLKVSIDDITRDMDDINFSSDNEDDNSTDELPLQTKRTKNTISIDGLDENSSASTQSLTLSPIVKAETHTVKLDNKKSTEFKKRNLLGESAGDNLVKKNKSKKKKSVSRSNDKNRLKTSDSSLREDTTPNSSSEKASGELQEAKKEKGGSRNRKKRAKYTGPTENKKTNQHSTEKDEDDVFGYSEAADALIEESEIDSVDVAEKENEQELNLERKTRKSRKKKKSKQQKAIHSESASNENDIEISHSDVKVLPGKEDEMNSAGELKKESVVGQETSAYIAEPNLSKSEKTKLYSNVAKEDPLLPSNPFAVKLRPTKNPKLNSKYSENLPEIQPIKTIIGLSHEQILKLDLSDVKIKIIVSSSSVSKHASNVLKFAIKHSHDLFSDWEKKKIFFSLCINVALYESIGFKMTFKPNPNILELFGDFDEINLEKTGTRLTPSNKDIHQNTLDYSVLSYIGHILIWSVHQQRQANRPLFIKKYDLKLPLALIKENIGGYHLWDRLLRESKSMNAKRWKHITKFRNAFPYEEDQFMLILRFMNVDDTIP